MKVQVREATPSQLNWLVAKCKGVIKGDALDIGFILEGGYTPSTDWAQAGPIIEREKISIEYMPGAGDAGLDVWIATRIEGSSVSEEQGPTPLVAAMRCYVASKLGDEVDVPEELMKEDKPDWRDPNSGCYCVVCLAPVREDIFVQRGGCCPNHKFDDECTYR